MSFKLNNHGWGLQAMMVSVLVIMIALVIVAALAQKTFGDLINNDNTNFSSKNDEKTYNNLEEKVVKAAKDYQVEYYGNMLDGDSITVTVKALKDKKMLTELKDNKTECSGYAILKKVNKKIDYQAYIKCGNKYETKGYIKSLDN